MDHHEIVFTYFDLAPRNILVERDRVTAILDWEYAGWSPEHWEYIQPFRHMADA
jgi:thiamine kinase-like enzyme